MAMVFSQSLVVPNNSSGNYLLPRPSLSVPYLRGMPFQLRFGLVAKLLARGLLGASQRHQACLLYTSDAADEERLV